jgi:hypothetical protein
MPNVQEQATSVRMSSVVLISVRANRQWSMKHDDHVGQVSYAMRNASW